MKRLLASLLLFISSSVCAQTQTTPELLNSGSWAGYGAVSNSNQTWDQIYGCCSGGPGALLLTNPNYGTGQIHFSWGQSTVAQIIAVNQALSGTGIQVTGYNWGWNISNGGVGLLTASVITRDNQDNVVHSFSQNYDNQVLQDVRFSGTQTYTNPYSLSSLSTLTMQFTGSDGLFWAGYYGPTVRNPSLTLNYTVDACAANPLSSPSCPNYQQAQCNISPLWSPTCPGYQQAYFTQQCSANPLYDPACPGYQQAYFDYQCSVSALYDTACPGYQQAYFNQQCSISALYSTSCPGYQQAYFDQQCSINPLYNVACPGYQQAFFNQQCSINGLYNQACPNYGAAYATRQILNQTLSPTTTTSTPTTTTTQTLTDPIVIAQSTPTTSTTSPTSVTSVTSVIVAPTPVPTTTVTSTAPTAPAPTVESRRTDAEVKSVTSGPNAQSRAASRAREAVRQTANAKSMEEQTASQGLLVGLIGFVPGFDAYSSARIADLNGQQMQRQYTKPPVDNRSVQRQLSVGSDRLHQRMIEDQYRR